MVLPAVALITLAFIVSSTASTAQLQDSDPIVDHPGPGNLSFMLGTWTEATVRAEKFGLATTFTAYIESENG